LALTAGCTAVVDGVVAAPGDAGEQTRIALGAGLAALAQVGVAPAQVVATRLSIVDRADAEAVGRAHVRCSPTSGRRPRWWWWPA